MPLNVGQVLQNRYRIVQLLGQGGFGAVYKAWDLNLDRPCAVKENLESTPEAQRQFFREAQLLADLAHPNMARVMDYFVIQGQGQYLVMNFVEGEDLQTMMNKSAGPLPVDQVIHWVGQICDALDYLHNQPSPIIHRDIKPANIRITSANRAVLVDFGIAKVWDPVRRTTTGAQAVTPGFSPFEQYGQAPTDARSDIYALAATAYALLTGQMPPESIARIAGTPLTPPHQFNLGVRPEVEAALLRAMEIPPEKRFPNAQDFKKALTVPPTSVLVTQPGRSAAVPYAAAGAQVPPAGRVVPKPAAAPAASPPARPLNLKKILPWMGGALILLAVAGTIIYLANRPPGGSAKPTAILALNTAAPATEAPAQGSATPGRTDKTPEPTATAINAAPPTLSAATAEPAVGSAEHPIRLLFAPQAETNIILSGGEVMVQALNAATGLHFEVNIPESIGTTIEELCASPDDSLAFLMGTAYVLANDLCGADASFKAERSGWGGYWAMFVVARSSGIQSLQDLSGKKWAYPDVSSISGYQVALLTLRDAGVAPGEEVQAGSHPATVSAVYSGDADFGTAFYTPWSPPEGAAQWQVGDDPEVPVDVNTCAVDGGSGQLLCQGYLPRDARYNIRDEHPDVIARVRILAISPEIPNEPVAFGPDFDPALRTQVEKALADFAESDAWNTSVGSADFYGWNGLLPAKDKDYDYLRRVVQLAGITIESMK